MPNEPLESALADLPLDDFDPELEIRVETLTDGHGMTEIAASDHSSNHCCCSC